MVRRASVTINIIVVVASIILSLTLFSCPSLNAIDISTYRFHKMPETSYYGGIHSISKDRVGRIWFSGYDAVYMFNGDSFIPVTDKIAALSPKAFWHFGHIVCDHSGRLYIATNQGLVKFDYKTESFSMVEHGNIGTIRLAEDGSIWLIKNNRVVAASVADSAKSKEYGTPPDVDIASLAMFCTRGNVYVTTKGRVYRLDPQTGEYSLLTELEGDGIVVTDVLDCADHIYILTRYNGLFACSSSGKVFKVYERPDGKTLAGAKELFLDSTGVIWAATQSGLLMIDPSEGSSNLLVSDLINPYSLPNNSVWSIFADPDGGVWIGTYGGKLAYVTLDDNDMTCYKASPGGLSHRIVSCFEEDEKGNLWIGTEGGGLNYWDRSTNRFTVFSAENGSGLRSDMVKYLSYKKSSGDLFVSCFSGGIKLLKSGSNKFIDVGVASLVDGQPLAIYGFEEEKGQGLWLSDPDSDLKFMNRKTGSVEIIRPKGKAEAEVRLRVETFFHDEYGELWLVTHSGVYVLDPVTREISEHYFIEDEDYVLNQLCCYCKASNGDIWFGSRGGGVVILKNDRKYAALSDKYGNNLFGKTVFGIVEDLATHDMWISTNGGLYVYNSSEDKLEKSRLDSNDNCGAYYVRSCFRTSKGEILFGGTDGFMIFTPSKIRTNSQKPKVYFTDLKIGNNSVSQAEDNSPLASSLQTMSEDEEVIRLKHSQSNFEIFFAPDNYFHAANNEYSYRMIGLTNEWTALPEGQRSVRFFNLPAGKYRFEIKAANNDGVWSDKVSSLQFKVKPSLFMSPLAMILYLLLLAGALFFIFRYFANKAEYERNMEMEKMKEKNMDELNQARIRFFTNISHDLKTPLSLIVDPLKRLGASLTPDNPAQTYVGLIDRNVKRLRHMISQLLQFREIESSKLTFNPQPDDLIKFLHSLLDLFEPYASRKGIETDFFSEYDSFNSSFDHEMTETIFTNLFSNAVKYTGQNGYVGVRINESSDADRKFLEQKLGEKGEVLSLSSSDKLLTITVVNTCEGIPEEQQKKIFERFSRGTRKSTDFETSSGLGLSIVSELLDNMKGCISLKSEDNKVSFIVTMPFATDDRPAVENAVKNSYDYTVDELDNMFSEEAYEERSESHARKHYDILIIEDDAELRRYMHDSLSESYNVYEAANGTEGIEVAKRVCPKIIVTDLSLPGSDGFEICRSMRTDIKTSHIPIIMLSGLGNDDNNRVKALESGANVFLDKPVDLDYLKGQIENLIRTQKEMMELYSKRYIAEPKDVAISSIDEKILRRAMDCIEKNMDNEDYNVDSFASDMAMGRTQLYQKIKDITGMSIKEFILSIRLKRAAQLLRDSDMTVSEISTMTGFANPKYFSICFKRHFDVSPTDFKKAESKN
jgi:signal transduction histidine kinase/DNA-binding response OmpR family regulator/ligand-binding sensor domain-containing protein